MFSISIPKVSLVKTQLIYCQLKRLRWSLASGTRVRGFKPGRWIFSVHEKILSERICPMSQLYGM
jgi:hypothetical protein